MKLLMWLAERIKGHSIVSLEALEPGQLFCRRCGHTQYRLFLLNCTKEQR
jgi:hypothetical protein